MVKYKNALGKNGSLINIEKIDKNDRYLNAPYYCLGCENELIANLGEIKAKHFSHKSDVNCNPETYRHKLAVISFYEIYKDCLKTKKPFYYMFEEPVSCSYFEYLTGNKCKKEIMTDYDLTKQFTVIEKEALYEGFRPDVLLSNNDKTEVIFVEMAVTHKCEKEKIEFGKRIIEITIPNTDIPLFKTREILESDEKIKLYNFIKKRNTKYSCAGNCHKLALIVSVDHTYKASMKVLNLKNLPDSNYKIIEIMDYMNPNYYKSYYREVRKMYFEGGAVKDCFICRNQGSKEDSRLLFCIADRKVYNSNKAINCPKYKPLISIFACDAKDTANRLYKEKSKQEYILKKQKEKASENKAWKIKKAEIKELYKKEQDESWTELREQFGITNKKNNST